MPAKKTDELIIDYDESVKKQVTYIKNVKTAIKAIKDTRKKLHSRKKDIDKLTKQELIEDLARMRNLFESITTRHQDLDYISNMKVSQLRQALNYYISDAGTGALLNFILDMK